jgi:hypothetical protein
MNPFFIIFFFIVVFCPVYSDDISTALTIKAKKSIKCSATPRKDVLSAGTAISQLSKGDELIFETGNYNRHIVIPNDKIIISGDQKGRCNATLKILGKGCIVKNIWLKNLTAEQNIIVVNCIIENFYSNNASKGKLNHIIYNTCIGKVYNLNRDAKITLKNCIGRNFDSIFKINNRTKIILQNSIFSSKDFVFQLLNRGTIKCKLSIDNSMVYGDNGIALDISARVRAKAMARTLKQLKKISNLTLHGNNQIGKIDFKSDFDYNEDEDLIFTPRAFQVVKKNKKSKIGIDEKLNPFFFDDFSQDLPNNWNAAYTETKRLIDLKLSE